MYFTPEATRSLIARISRSLTPGGFLFLGHAETLRNISQDFYLRHTHETFYYQRREGWEAPRAAIFPGDSACNDSVDMIIPPVASPSDSWFSIIQQASERVLNLTEDRSRPGDGGCQAAISRRMNSSHSAAPPTLSWDRTVAIELMRGERFAGRPLSCCSLFRQNQRRTRMHNCYWQRFSPTVADSPRPRKSVSISLRLMR